MKKTSIGGQALIEGLMMIGPETAAIAVRKPDRNIVIEKRPLPVKGQLSKIPICRGAINIFRQLILGTKALMFSAEISDIEETMQTRREKESSWYERHIEKIWGDKSFEVLVTICVFLSIGFSIGLFILLPNILAGFLPFNKDSWNGIFYYNLFEGIIRIVIFLGYVILTSIQKDIQRVWEYHGAEHKTINCYEHEEELTVSNVKKYRTQNPRCGTSFMFLVMIVSILLFSFVGWHAPVLNVFIRLLLVPLVAGVAYEVIMLAARKESIWFNIISAPGYLLQMFTTREPDDHQIEVAIAAFNSVLLVNDDAASC